MSSGVSEQQRHRSDCAQSGFEMIFSNKGITKVLIRLCRCTGWSVPLLFANPEDRLPCVEVNIVRPLFILAYPITSLFLDLILSFFYFCSY